LASTGEWDEERVQQEAFGDQGYVYFIEAEGDPVIKIGTTCDPAARLAKLQAGNARKLRFRQIILGGWDDEQRWHQEWSHLCVRGEWFELTDDLKTAIDTTSSWDATSTCPSSIASPSVAEPNTNTQAPSIAPSDVADPLDDEMPTFLVRALAC
jgi:hypothetical protein